MILHYRHNNTTSILYSYQKGYFGRPWAQVSPGCCQRHARVLGPVQSVAQMGCLSELGSDPNPFRYTARSIISSYVTRIDSLSRLSSRFTGFSTTEYNGNRVSTSPSCRQNVLFSRPKQQTDGGQPWANGLPRTTRNRHQRQQVLDPNQSMNLGGVSRKWGGDQNLTERYVVGKQNSCDTVPLSIDLRPSGRPLTSRLSYGEVGR